MRRLALAVLPPLLLSMLPSLTGAEAAADEPPPVAGQRWTEFAPIVGPQDGRPQAAALTADGSVLLAGSTDPQHYGISKVAVPTGTPRSDFGRDGYVDLTDVLPTGTPLDVAARADGGAYLLLEKSLRLRYEDPQTRPLTVGVTAITGDGRPDPAFGSIPNFGQVGTRYLAPREGSEITGVGGIAMGAGDEPVIAYTEKHPGEVTEVNPTPAPQTDVILRRLDHDGTVDAAYGDGGLARWVDPVQLQPGMAGSVEVERVRAAGGGAVLVLVKSLLYSPQTSERHQRLHVLRFTAAGDLDPGFGDGGAVEVAAARPDCGPDTNTGIRTPLAVGPGGSFVVVSSLVDGNGYCSEPSGYDDPSDLLVNVYEPDGTPDATFSSDGRLVHHVVQREVPSDPDSRDLMKVNEPEAVLMDRLGRVVVAVQGAGSSTYGGLVRFSDTGALDEGFGASAGDFSAPTPYAGNDLLETPTDDYLMAGAPYEPFAFRFAQASLYLADGDLPTSSATPVPDPGDEPRIMERQDRALRPGDELELRLGTWTGPAVDRFEIAWLGCESRHQTNSRCVDQPLGRSVADGQATTATFELPEHAAGQYLSATVVAVASDGARGRKTVYGGTMGPSRHLIEEVPDTGLLDLTNNRFGEGEVFALADGTIGSVYAAFGQVFDGRLRILEKSPGEERSVVVARDDIQRVQVKDVVTTTDGWVHVVLTSGLDGNVYAVDRDPATGTWSEVVQLSNVGNADGEARLRVGYGGVSAAPGGRVAVAWAELQARGDDAPPPVAVRVRTPDGWQPVHYLPEDLEVSCGDGTKTCYPDPPGDGRTWDARAPLVTVTASGAVQVAWQRQAGVHAHSFSWIAHTARQSPTGDWSAPTRLVPVAHADLTPVRLAALADGSILFLAREAFDNARRERLILQVVPAGASVSPDQGDGFPGQVLRSYGLVDEVDTSVGGNHTFPLVVDGTHWRLALSEDVSRAGNPQTRRLLTLEGVGSALQPIQTLDRRDPNTGAYDVTFAAAPGGKALLVTDSQSGHPTDLEYALADGNGPMTRLQPVRAELPGGSVHLEPAPETGSAGEARNLGLREVRGSWQLTTLSRQGALRAHRLAGGTAGPRVAVAYGERLPRPGRPYSVAVDPERTFDPDGGQLDLAWDLDGDGAYDDATGPQASVVPGPAGEEQLVAVRATSADGDRAEAAGSVYPVENQAPDLYQLDGPTTADAGEDVLFEAWAYDDESEDLLTYTWYVGNVAQPNQTGPTAQLTLPAGSVTVRVVVTDSDGESDEASRTVDVSPGPEEPNQAPTVAVSGPGTAVDGDVTRFVAVAADDAGVAALRYVWKMDGKVVAGASGARADLVLASGTRKVSATVVDTEGLAATSVKTVRVTVSGTRLPDQPVRFVSLSGKLLKVTATVPKKGAVGVVLRKAGTKTVLAAATVKVSGKGVKSLTLKLTAAGVRALRAKGSYAVDAMTTFTPARGAKQVRTHRVTVVRR